MIHALDIRMTREEFEAMSQEQREKWLNIVTDAMTPEQLEQMSRIGYRAIKDMVSGDVLTRPKTALQDMAKSVNVTVNKSKG